MSKNTDINGKESAKRVNAQKFINTGLAITIGYSIVWAVSAVVFLIRGGTIPEFPQTLFWMWATMIGSGIVNLGMTLFEPKKLTQ